MRLPRSLAVVVSGIAAIQSIACSGDSPSGPGGPYEVEVARSSLAVAAGDTVRIDWTVRDTTGLPVSAAPRFVSRDGRTARVDRAGLVTGVAAGETEILAIAGGDTAVVAVRVSRAVAYFDLGGVPEALLDSIMVGRSYRVTVTAYDSAGQILEDAPVSFSTSDSTIAVVDSTGLIQAAWVGNAIVTIRAGGIWTHLPVNARVVRIGAGQSWAALDGGSHYACALTTAGDPFCFGEAFNARTGFATDVWEPARIPGDNRFRAIYAGGTHSCGLDLVDSTAWCWGPSRHGQLGNAERLPGDLRYVPYQEESRRPWAWLTVGGHGGNCGFSAGDSLLHCWGHNDMAQLGFTPRERPRTGFVSGTIDIWGPTLGWRGMKARDASVDNNHGCMLTSTGIAYCSASGSGSWVGRDPADQDSVPWRVVGDHRFTAIGTGQVSTCAIRDGDARILCWGNNLRGILGAGEAELLNRYTPGPIASPLAFDRLRMTEVGACARATNGEWWCWGEGVGSRPRRIPGEWRTIEPSGKFTCGLPPTGAIVCWGDGDWWEGSGAARFVTLRARTRIGVTPPGSLLH